MLYIDRLNSIQQAIVAQRMRTWRNLLGPDDLLHEVIDEDVRTLQQHRVTHAQIAAAMERIMGHPEECIGIRQVSPPMDCPFELSVVPLYADQEFTVRVGDQQISFVGIMAHLIGNHQFFGGKQSPYRVDPALAVQLLQRTSDQVPGKSSVAA
jgi:hypothetical protein